ncbi:heterogeneous nuclear ribonucleoprotein U-like protein 1 [Rosa chinensis]|uniref:heterogeneous nuclear ribonucleoprotein U-like protein 1 n=1 Tax=Rosa chinensis TaxID=74649 RepID=UPI001AD8D180|nr:heterogeneous nuclear ribonucleoprotein U-like protein 1 [Rosa chinensis]
MRSPCYGEKFGLGDTIVCAVSLEEKPLASISFSKNGKCLGTAMKFNAAMDPEVKNFQWEFAFFPQLLLKNVEVELQFSVEDELVLEDGFKPCLAALRDGNAIGGPVFDDPKDCEMMMMVGMPASGKTTGAKKWVKDHPEKRYVFVGINMVFDQMKVCGHCLMCTFLFIISFLLLDRKRDRY